MRERLSSTKSECIYVVMQVMFLLHNIFLLQTSLHFMKSPHLYPSYSLFLGLQFMSYLRHYCQIIQLFLQFVQDAISKQLDALSDTSPSLRVGIITFSDEVSVITY